MTISINFINLHQFDLYLCLRNANHTEPSAAETPMARVGTGLDTLTTFLQPLLQEHLRTHLDNLPR